MAGATGGRPFGPLVMRVGGSYNGYETEGPTVRCIMANLITRLDDVVLKGSMPAETFNMSVDDDDDDSEYDDDPILAALFADDSEEALRKIELYLWGEKSDDDDDGDPMITALSEHDFEKAKDLFPFMERDCASEILCP